MSMNRFQSPYLLPINVAHKIYEDVIAGRAAKNGSFFH